MAVDTLDVPDDIDQDELARLAKYEADAEDGALITRGWEEFLAAVLPQDANPDVVEELRRVWFSAVAHTMDALTTLVWLHPSDLVYSESIYGELDDFFKEQVAATMSEPQGSA